MPFPEVLRVEIRNSLKSFREIALKQHWKSLCRRFPSLRGPPRLSLSDVTASLLLFRIVSKDILEDDSLLRTIQHNVLQ